MGIFSTQPHITISKDGRSYTGYPFPWKCLGCKQKFKHCDDDFYKSVCSCSNANFNQRPHWEIKECLEFDEYQKSETYARQPVSSCPTQ